MRFPCQDNLNAVKRPEKLLRKNMRMMCVCVWVCMSASRPSLSKVTLTERRVRGAAASCHV